MLEVFRGYTFNSLLVVYPLAGIIPEARNKNFLLPDRGLTVKEAGVAVPAPKPCNTTALSPVGVLFL